MTQLSAFTWGMFPYICLGVMVIGTLYRYQSDQLHWGSKSSELLEKKLLMVGSMLFHVGILFVFAGHVAGLLVPVQFYNVIGVSSELYHKAAIGLGGFSGLMALVGISILLYRRIANGRVRMNSDFSDYLADGLLLLVILLGLAFTVGYGVLYGPYEYRATVGPWVRGVLTLRPDVTLMAGVPLLLQAHIMLAFLLIGISPFTRLVHMYSIPFGYVMRAPVLYRARFGYGYVATPRSRAARPGPRVQPHPAPWRPAEEPARPEPVNRFERAIRESLDPVAGSRKR